MDNNSQFQLRDSAMNVDGNLPLPIVEPIDINSGGDGGSNGGNNSGTDTGNGATVTTPTNIKDEPTPIVEPTPLKPETGYEKAERYANLSIRWAIVLVMLALTYNLVKQYRAPKPIAPTA